MRNLKRWMVLMILGALLLSIPLALAQEEAPAPTNEIAVPGISVGVLLLGLLAVVSVGGAIIIRDSYNPENESE